MTGALSDETLMAYADGELDDAERIRVGKILDGNPEARARLRVFQTTGNSLAPAFDPPERPLPAALSVPVRGDAQSEARGGMSSWADRLRDWLHTVSAQQAALAAAVIALAFTGGALWQRTMPSAPGEAALMAAEDGGFRAAGRLAGVLETAGSDPSGPEHAEIAVLQTFRNAEGGYCREYVLRGPGEAGYAAGVACRRADGAWRIAVHAAEDGPVSPESYTPAGGGTQRIVDGYVHDIMQGAPLDGEAEQEALKRGWR